MFYVLLCCFVGLKNKRLIKIYEIYEDSKSTPFWRAYKSEGTLIFHIFGALAQFERDLIQERTQAGLKAAAARGRKDGRKLVMNNEKLLRAKQLIKSGLNVREAAARLKIGKTSLYTALKQVKMLQSL